MSEYKKRSSILKYAAIILLLVFGGCKNPFEAGLGDKIDINKPEVSLITPVPGEFLNGPVTFSGTATDDSRVTAVRISFDRGATWHDVSSFSSASTLWHHDLDTETALIPNGLFYVRVRVTDDSGKTTETEELVFTVDNAAPVVEIQVPAINTSADPAPYLLDPPEVAMNGVIVGIVTDLEGVAVGSPEIKFWPEAGSEPAVWTALRPDVTAPLQALDYRYRIGDYFPDAVGNFYVKLRAEDASGKLTETATYIVTLVSSDTPPVISGFAFTAGGVVTAGGNNYARQAYRFGLSAYHANAIADFTLTRSKDGGAAVPLAWGSDDLGTPTRAVESPLFAVAADGSDDGVYEFSIEAVSGTGSTAELTRTVIVDATEPEVEITNLRPTVIDSTDPDNPIEQVNGTILVNVAAGDANGLQGVKWWMQPAADAAPTAYDSAGGTAFASTPYAMTIDSTTLTDNTEYKLYIAARDRAGNDTIISRAVTIKQSTDFPTAAFTDINPAITTAGAAGVAGANLLDTNARIRGTIEDDDMVDIATVKISLNGGGWIPVGTVGPAAKSVAFSHNVDGLGQGVHNFRLQFSDDPAAKFGASPTAVTTMVAAAGPVYFVIDTAPPAVAVTSPGPGTFQRAQFELSGTAEDANGLSTFDFGGVTGVKGYVEIASPEAPAVWTKVPVDSGTNAWTYTVGAAPSVLFGGAWEGARTVSVRSTDRFGKLTTISFNFTVDTIAPTPVVDAPLATDWLSGVTGSVQGTASDTGSGVNQVRYWIGDFGAAPPASTDDWSIASGTTGWNGSANLSALGEGTKTAHVRVRDAAGNWSGAVTRNFGVDQNAPGLTETTIIAASAGRNAVFSLDGGITDTNALKSLVVTQKKGAGAAVEIYRDDAVSGTSQAWHVTDLPRDPLAADPTLPVAALVDGVYAYTVTVTDAAGKTAILTRTVTVDQLGPVVTISSPSPAALVQGTALLINGTASDVGDVSAISEVRFHADDTGSPAPAAYADWTLAAGGSNWSASLNLTTLGEGSKTLKVVALDAAGNWSETEETVIFMVDQSAPTLSVFAFEPGKINTVLGSNYSKSVFNFTVTAADSNLISSVTLTESRDGGAPADVTWASGDTGNTLRNLTSPELPSYRNAGSVVDGTYDYIITVTDTAGRAAVLNRSVVVDLTAPGLEITNLSPVVTDGTTTWVNGRLNFGAAATDTNGLLGVKWWIKPAADAAPANYDEAGGTLFATTPYASSIDTRPPADGGVLADDTDYTLYVMTRDRSLNESIQSRNFTVDQDSDLPAAAFTDIDPSVALEADASDNLFELNARIRGSITDDDRVKASSIQIAVHPAASYPAAVYNPVTTVGADGSSVSFTHNLAVVDGVYYFYLQFSDDTAAKDTLPAVTETVGPIWFVIDTQNPDAAFSAPAVNSYQTGNFLVSGTSFDVSGVTAVAVSTDGATWNPAVSGGIPAYSTWTYNVDVGAITDGVLPIRARATDRYGKTTIIERQVTIDREIPAVSITGPESAVVVNSTVKIQGTSSDNFELAAAYWRIEPEFTVPADPSVDLTGWTAFAGRYSWEYDWDTVLFQDAEQGNYDPANYTVHVAGRDAAGNWSVIKTVTVTVDQTSDKPTVDLTTLNIAEENLLPTTLRISGTAGDDDGVDIGSVQVRADTEADVPVFGWTDVSVPPTTGGKLVSWSHVFSGATALTDGRYKLYVRAADTGDALSYSAFKSREIGPVSIAVDLANPEGTITYPLQGAFTNQLSFNITGTASDTSGVKSVEIRFGTSDPVPVADTSGADPDFSTWTYAYTAVDEGQKSYQLIITDMFNKVTTIDRYFTIDRQAPTVAFIQPDAAAVVNGSLLVRGSATDDYLVSKISFALQKTSAPADPAPVYPGDYTLLTGTFSWETRINTTLYPVDGEYTLHIVAEDGAGNDSSAAPVTRILNFNQSTNLPVVTVTNASGDSGTPTLFGLGGSIMGTVTDDDGVDPDTIEISFDNGTSWLPVTPPAGSGGVSVNFSYNVGGVLESAAAYTVLVRANDVGQTEFGVGVASGTSTAVYVGVDRNNPAVAIGTVDIVDPYGGAGRTNIPIAAGLLINDDFTLRGTASDASGITAVLVTLNGTDYFPATLAAGTWSYVVPVTRAPASDGPMTISVLAIDEWDKVSTAAATVVIDTSEPVVTFIEPANFDAHLNGSVRIRGTNSDANPISSMLIQLGKTFAELIPTGTLLSWETTINSPDYAVLTHGTETPADSNVWYVPLRLTVRDAAQNRKIEDRELRIDPNSDKPTSAITSPANLASVPTEFAFQGTITDDDPAPMRVVLSVDANGGEAGDGTFEIALGEITGITNGSWVMTIDTADTGVFPVPPTGYIHLKAVPYDRFNLAGGETVHRVFVDASAPTISGLSPVDGSVLKGEVNITGTFRDDQALQTSQMRISLNGGTTFQAISSIIGYSITGPTMEGSVYRYDFSVPVNTTTVVAGGNGYLPVAVRITDATFKQSTVSADLSADNTRPSLDINYDGSMDFVHSGGSDIFTFEGKAGVGGSYRVIGSSVDSGTVSSVSRVDLYFVKGGKFLGVRSAVPALDVISVDIHNQGGVLETIPYREPALVGGVLKDDYVITINNRFERGIYDTDDSFGDKDDFQESLRSMGTYDEWFADFDTTLLPDGPMTIYAVVYDGAGNRSYLSAPGQISNNPPVITSVEVTPAAELYAGLIKRTGELYLKVNATDVEGINTSSYKATLTRKQVAPNGVDTTDGPALETSFSLDASGIGTIDMAEAAAPNFFVSGVQYTLTVEVKDTDGNIATKDIMVWLNNTDISDPKVSLDFFTQNSVAGLAGHVEEKEYSPFANGRAALSGTVHITGTAYDDTAVTAVEVSFDNGANWVPATTVTLTNSDVLLGNDYTWSYTWDTADTLVPGVSQIARMNQQIKVRALDGAANEGYLTKTSADPTLYADIVPYITNILTGMDSGLRSFVKRSALGRYPVAVGSGITVEGYNFDGTSSAVTVGGTSATVSGGGASSLTVNLGAITSSGELIVTTSGITSQNHANTPSLPQNKEPNAYNDTLTDNRYIAFWQREVHAATEYQGAVDAVMHPNGDRNDFDWIYAKNGRELRHYRGFTDDNIKVTEGNALSGGDFTFNTDKSMSFLFNHSNTWYPTSTSYEYSGSMQWGLLPNGAAYNYAADPDAAYNWAVNAGLPRAGLGNHSFNGNPMTWTPYNSYNTLDINRYKNPRLVTKGTNSASRVYAAYFDAGAGQSRNLVFWNFKVGTVKTDVDGSGSYYRRTGTTAGAITMTASYGTWYGNIDRYFTASNDAGRFSLTGNQDNNNYGIATPRGRQQITSVNSSANSEYFDLGIYEAVPASTHYAFIAYYDGAAGSLKITANEGVYTADPLVAGTWTAPFTVDTNAGAHVAMAVDPNGGIHLAYQETSNSYLKYAYLTYTAGGTFTVQKKVYVDALIAAGQYNSIRIKDFDTGLGTDYRPIITTYSSAFAGTNAALRTLYPIYAPTHASFGAGANSSTGKFTGLWESVAVVASGNPQGSRNFTFTNGGAVTEGRIHVGYNAAYLEENTYLGID